MADYRLVWFQHLHKAAGTYVIRRAMANGETFWPDHENGNPVNEGKVIPLWDMASDKLTSFIDECEERGVTFVACEWGGPDYQTLANDERVTLLTCLRQPIKRLISNYNYDHYWMWTKATSYEEYLREGHLHSSPEYYTKIFARGELDLDLAKSNLESFDHVIVAEDGMGALDELGWPKESDTTHPTFGDRKRALILFAKLRWSRLFNYLKKRKYQPPEGLGITELNKLDLELYDSMRI
ncbi:MAG: hypothetical protein QF445_04760 [Candidatus Poseidoniaceae archaeon]|jgi:hypothetical protein|nr:hypothetical protein [Candidatus Poseidoniaceae archaeon]|tara:strand:- start:529 stop:1245 length:717 start_codon:yes stop_codon:yes gene_type:complete